MKSKTKMESRTISLDSRTWRLLELWANEEMRPVDNFIEWLVECNRSWLYEGKEPKRYIFTIPTEKSGQGGEDDKIVTG